MKVFVTGGTGFVGSHLVERLCADGDAVTALVRPSSDAARLRSLGVHVVTGDLLDQAALRSAAAGCDVTYHLAAARTVTTSDRRVFHDVNVRGTDCLLRAVRESGAGRVVHCSTGGVHGPSWSVIHEDSPLRPDGPYRTTRLAAERIAAAHRERHGLPIVVARLTGVYGPRDRTLLPLFREVAQGRLNLPGSGRHAIHLSYVDDVVEGLVRCGRTLQAIGRTYLIGNARPLSLWQFIEAIAGAAGARIRRRSFLEPPMRAAIAFYDAALRPLGLCPPGVKKLEFLARPHRYDVSRARREIGLPDGIPVQEGVRRTLDWYRGNGDV